ncbi:hypothetical protein PRIPAC_92273, partial [Pristionchus pacificus]|uniref:Tudor-knot domain-containing protein n=1 Tax=Pristionchus pacificus TaxID=54126 RepID=A0A2A6CDF5_PRIPA
ATTMTTPLFNVGDRIYGKVKPIDPIASLGVIKSVQEGADGRRYRIAYEGYGEKDGHFVEPYNAAYQIFDANIVEGVRRKRAEQFKHSLEVGCDYFGDTERPRISNEESFAVGDEVSCLWVDNNSVYKANIIDLEVSDGDFRYKVHFPKFGRHWDQWVEAQEVPFLLSRTKKKLEEIAKRNKALAKSKPIATGDLAKQKSDKEGDMGDKENASRKRKRRTGQFEDDVEDGNNNNEDGGGERDEVAPRKIRKRTMDLRENMTEGRGGYRGSSLMGEASIYLLFINREEEGQKNSKELKRKRKGKAAISMWMMWPVELKKMEGGPEDEEDEEHSEEVIIDGTPTEYNPEEMEIIRCRAVDEIPALFDRTKASSDEISKEDKIRDCLMWSRPKDCQLDLSPLRRRFRSSSWLELLNSTRSTNSQSSEFPFGRKPDHDREQEEFSKEEIECFIREMVRPETSKNFYRMRMGSFAERTTSELVHYHYHMNRAIIPEESELYHKLKEQQRRLEAIERNLMGTIESRFRPDDWKESKMRITAPLRSIVEYSNDDERHSDEVEDDNMANQEAFLNEDVEERTVMDLTNVKKQELIENSAKHLNETTMNASIAAPHENIDSDHASSSSHRENNFNILPDVEELSVKREANENRSDEQEIDEGGEEVGSGGGTEPIDQSKPVRERSGLRKRTKLAAYLGSIGFFDYQEDLPHNSRQHTPLSESGIASGSFEVPREPVPKPATREEHKTLMKKKKGRNGKGSSFTTKAIKIEDRECSPMSEVSITDIATQSLVKKEADHNSRSASRTKRFDDEEFDFVVPSTPSSLPRSSSLVSSASGTLSNSQTESLIGQSDRNVGDGGVKNGPYREVADTLLREVFERAEKAEKRAEDAERENDELKKKITAMQRTMKLGVRLVTRMADHPDRLDDVEAMMTNLLAKWNNQTAVEEN